MDDKDNSFEVNDGKEDSLQKENSVGKRKRMIIELVIYAFVLFFAAFIVPKYLLQRSIVDGSSMENTLHDGDNLWVEKITKNYDRFDIILFYPYGREQKEDYYIKRVIGLPGETVQIIGEDIFINGEKLEEDYGKESIDYAGIAHEEIVLKEDEYFVLGDNRRNSTDSRDNRVGPVKKENIGGKALLRIWPLSRFGKID